jgi:hypothetical protein
MSKTKEELADSLRELVSQTRSDMDHVEELMDESGPLEDNLILAGVAVGSACFALDGWCGELAEAIDAKEV